MTKLVIKNLSKFQQQAYGGTFRHDNRLLVSGDEEGCVRLFDVNSKNILRLFKGHKAPVHRTFFSSDTNIISYSDDKTVKVWDIPTEKITFTFEEHKDYVRAGCVSQLSPNIIMSGGYDKIVKMYDTRTNTSIMTVDHGSPVESMLILPTGGIFITAGGTEIKVWDALGGGKLIANIMQHHKTVTCLRLASKGKRLLSGSLDRHCKIYDIATYQVVHNIDFPNAILSLGVAENDGVLVGGLVDGTVSVFRREDPEQEEEQPFPKQHRRFNIREVADEVVTEAKYETQSRYDKYFRKYEYAKALSFVLKPHFTRKSPQVTVAVIRELIHRKGLDRALAGRAQQSLLRLVNFIKTYISDYRFNRTLIDTGNTLIDVYEHEFHTFSSPLQTAIIQLKDRLKEEEELTTSLLELKGALELLLNASNVITTEDMDHATHLYDNLQDASEDAKQKSIITVE